MGLGLTLRNEINIEQQIELTVELIQDLSIRLSLLCPFSHYVYALADPRDNQIFYIGKGGGTPKTANDEKENSEYISGLINNIKDKEFEHISDIINDIKEDGYEVKCYILRLGLDDDSVASTVKSALIDILKYNAFDFETKIFDDTEKETEIQTLEAAERNLNIDNYEPNVLAIDLINVSEDIIADINNPKYNTDRLDILLQLMKNNCYLHRDEIDKKDSILNDDVDFIFCVHNGVVQEIFVPNPVSANQNNKWDWRFSKSDSNKLYYIFDGVVCQEQAIRNKYLNKNLFANEMKKITIFKAKNY